jgi:hypothetical protein
MAILLAGLTGTGALLVEIRTETCLQRVLDEDVFGRAYALAQPAPVGGIVAGSLVAPALVAALGGIGRAHRGRHSGLAYALIVARETEPVPSAVPAGPVPVPAGTGTPSQVIR